LKLLPQQATFLPVTAKGNAFSQSIGGASVLEKSILLQIVGGLGEVGGTAEVTPIVVIGAKGEDVFSLGGEAKIGRDNGENAFFGEHRKKAGRDDVDAGKGQ
jgi:hypothetical protein